MRGLGSQLSLRTRIIGVFFLFKSYENFHLNCLQFLSGRCPLGAILALPGLAWILRLSLFYSRLSWAFDHHQWESRGSGCARIGFLWKLRCVSIILSNIGTNVNLILDWLRCMTQGWERMQKAEKTTDQHWLPGCTSAGCVRVRGCQIWTRQLLEAYVALKWVAPQHRFDETKQYYKHTKDVPDYLGKLRQAVVS